MGVLASPVIFSQAAGAQFRVLGVFMPLQKTENIWHNGKLIPWDEATLHVIVAT